MCKLIYILFCVLLFTSCHTSPAEKINPGTETTASEFKSISSLAFIGGSVVYNPSNRSSSQLYNGAEIAFYLSSLETASIPASVYDAFGNKVDLEDEITSVIPNKSNDIYGYLHIDSVSPSSITLTYYKYSKNGSTKTAKSHTINKDASLDINGDGNPDLKYKALLPIRDGFEGAMCLEFISSQEKLYASMYATMTEDTLNKTSKSLDEYSHKTFYGMNSEGDFIYIVSNDEIDSAAKTIRKSADVVGISHGDYVINKNTGEIKSVVGDNDSGEHGSYMLMDSEDYINASSDTANGNDLLLLESFLSYFYDINQFPSVDGPKELVKALPEALLLKVYSIKYNDAEYVSYDSLPSDFYSRDEYFYIDILNSILNSPLGTEPIFIIAQEEEIDLTAEDKKNIKELFYDTVRSMYSEEDANNIIDAYDLNNPEEAQKITDEIEYTDAYKEKHYKEDAYAKASLHLIASIRTYIENIYPESPKAIVPVPDITTVYPLMSLNIGEIPTNLNQFEGDKLNYTVAKSATESYEDFASQKKEIDKVFKDFYSISLKNIKISDIGNTDSNGNSKPKVEEVKKSDNDKAKPTVIDPNALHFDLAFGVTGSINTRWGHLDCSLASAVYVAAGANFSEITKCFNICEEKLADPSTTFFVGPVPLTLSMKTVFAIDLNATLSSPINFFVGYCGLYGGGVSFDADYGLKTKKKYHIPYITGYFDPSFETEMINYTISYAGPIEPNAVTTDMDKLELILTPKLKINPQIAIGPKYAYAGMTLPITMKSDIGFAAHSVDTLDESTLSNLDRDFWIKQYLLPGNKYRVFEKLTIGANIKAGPVIGVQLPIINKKVETNWTTKKLFDLEMGFRESGFAVIGTIIGNDYDIGLDF